jgi:hypothetical protein
MQSSKVFLSHSSEDKPHVRRLAKKLEENGVATWFDEWDLLPGDRWQTEIEAALRSCKTCLVIVGTNPLGPWQRQEMEVLIDRGARENQFRIIPVLLPGFERGKRGAVSSFLANINWVEFHRSIDEDAGFERLLRSIRGERMRAGSPLASGGRCPYQGLRTFDMNDAGYFLDATCSANGWWPIPGGYYARIRTRASWPSSAPPAAASRHSPAPACCTDWNTAP